MRVQVDEAGAHDPAVGLDGAIGRPVETLGHLDDAAAFDGDVGSPTRRARPVDDQPSPDVHVVAHQDLPRRLDSRRTNTDGGRDESRDT